MSRGMLATEVVRVLQGLLVRAFLTIPSLVTRRAYVDVYTPSCSMGWTMCAPRVARLATVTPVAAARMPRITGGAYISVLHHTMCNVLCSLRALRVGRLFVASLARQLPQITSIATSDTLKMLSPLR